MPTEWRPVEGYEGRYEVSRSGFVRSLPRDYGFGIVEKPTLLKPDQDRFGYLTVRLCKDEKKQKFLVHRLVASAFVPLVKGKPFVNHKDEDKLNNHASNLEWVTTAENNAHGTRNERIAKRVSRQIEQIDPSNGNIVKTWPSLKKLCEETGWDMSCISECCNGKRKTSHGYMWRKVRK